MLVRLEDIKGRVCWINPVHVKAVTEDKKGRAQVCVSFTGIGVMSANTAVVVDEPADLVAQRINAAMPDMVMTMGYAPEDTGGGDDGTNAAAIAVMSG